MNKKDVIYAIVGFVLIIALVLGMVVFLGKKKDDKIDETKTTEAKVTDVNGDVVSTAKPTASTYPGFYIDDYVGYKTIGTTTYFFVVVPIAKVYQSDNFPGMDINLVGKKFTSVTITKIGNLNDEYKGNPCQIKKSLDGGETWTDMDYGLDSGAGDCTYIDYFTPGTEVYLSYCTVENCSNPMNFLSVLKRDVFGEKIEMVSDTYGLYWCFEGFTYTMIGVDLY